MLTRRSFLGIVAGSIVAPLAALLRADKPVEVESGKVCVGIDVATEKSRSVFTIMPIPFDPKAPFYRTVLGPGGDALYTLDDHGNPIRIVNGVAQGAVREGQTLYWSEHSDPNNYEPHVTLSSNGGYEMTFAEPRFT